MDNLIDKAKNLSQSSPSAKVAKYVGELQTKYEKLCDTSKQMLDKLEASVKDHQQYQDMYQDCQDWLNSSREKVELCADTSGDKMSLNNKLERLKVRLSSNIGVRTGSTPHGKKSSYVPIHPVTRCLLIISWKD